MQSKILLLTLTINVIVFQVIAEPVYAQTNEFKITASDGDSTDFFGISVSLSGDYAIVGANGDEENGTRSGSVYVFKRTGDDWIEETKLLPSDGKKDDFFGLSVSISGDYVIVGSYSESDSNGVFRNSGSAYIFKRDSIIWTQESKLFPTDESLLFGRSVSISGDYAIIGARYGAGAAHLFKREGSSWSEEAKLLASDGNDGDEFGLPVFISGDYAIVGAVGNDDNGQESGSAYIFKRDDTTWVEEAKLLPSDGAFNDRFGFSVAISGDHAVVGVPEDDDNGNYSGSVYIFKRTDSTWIEETKWIASDGDIKDGFGFSVAISAEHTIVGAFRNDDDGLNSGSAYIYNGFAPVVGVGSERVSLPEEFSLSQNYPNPFNPETIIEFSLPKMGDISLKVFNLTGQEVALLINGIMPVGNHQVIWNASSFASGIYFYRLQAGNFVQTRKMVLLK